MYGSSGMVDVEGSSDKEGSGVWGVMTGELRELILYWTQSLTYTLNLMFFFIRASSTLLVHLILFTNYLYTDYCPKEFLSNISKKEMPTLDRL